MIDNDRRRKLALHLRQLSVGLISNDQFEDRVMDDISEGWLPEQYYRSPKVEFDDPIILPMLELSWSFYDDTRNHKLKRGDRLSDDSLKLIARCILFLHSGRAYEWPPYFTNNPLFRFTWKELFLTLVTLGYTYRKKRREQNESFIKFCKLDDYDYWPFFKEGDYNEQMKRPPFLASN